MLLRGIIELYWPHPQALSVSLPGQKEMNSFVLLCAFYHDFCFIIDPKRQVKATMGCNYANVAKR